MEFRSYEKSRTQVLRLFSLIENKFLFSDRNRPSYADDIEWLRPHEICEAEGLQPALFKDGASKFDVVQVYTIAIFISLKSLQK